MKETSIDKLAAVEAATIVRRTDASNRIMDIDVKWKENNIIKWRKNLKDADIMLQVQPFIDSARNIAFIHLKIHLGYCECDTYLPNSGLYPIT